jgi:hypothetical protein
MSQFPRLRTCLPCLASLAAVCLSITCAAISAAPAAAQTSDPEIIANLAAGKTIIWVARDAILVSTESRKVETGSLAPVVVPLDTSHVAILFGAVEWQQPGSAVAPIELGALLGNLHGLAGKALPTLAVEKNEASDIEVLGVGFLDSLRTVTSRIHHKLDLKPDEPLVELILADFAPDYGPEVWRLSYRVKQTELRDDFWDTQALRPSFDQLYPPEKKDPKVLVEFAYPGGDPPGHTMNDLLGQNDPRLRPIRDADPKVAEAAQKIVDGASNKADPQAATNFLKSALQVTAPKDSQLSLAVLYGDDRFTWVLEPPEQPANTPKRDADAPTLRRIPHQ